MSDFLDRVVFGVKVVLGFDPPPLESSSKHSKQKSRKDSSVFICGKCSKEHYVPNLYCDECREMYSGKVKYNSSENFNTGWYCIVYEDKEGVCYTYFLEATKGESPEKKFHRLHVGYATIDQIYKRVWARK